MEWPRAVSASQEFLLSGAFGSEKLVVTVLATE